MHTTTLKPSGRNLEYLADSQFDKDIYTNAKYIKDSIDYNDNPVSIWLGNSSVELKQVSDILRAYVQLVLNGYVNEFRPNGYPKESIERIGAAAGQYDQGLASLFGQRQQQENTLNQQLGANTMDRGRLAEMTAYTNQQTGNPWQHLLSMIQGGANMGSGLDTLFRGDTVNIPQPTQENISNMALLSQQNPNLPLMNQYKYNSYNPYGGY